MQHMHAIQCSQLHLKSRECIRSVRNFLINKNTHPLSASCVRPAMASRIPDNGNIVAVIKHIVQRKKLDRGIREGMYRQQTAECGTQPHQALDDQIQEGGVVVIFAPVFVWGRKLFPIAIGRGAVWQQNVLCNLAARHVRVRAVVVRVGGGYAL